jgi:N-acetyl-anhydromuramyl-L-alanine amidase AmpD
MRAQHAAELFTLARELAVSSRKRGLTPQEALAVIARALPGLLADQPQLQEALVALVRRPACVKLLAEDPEGAAQVREQLLDQDGAMVSAPSEAQGAAFVDGLLEGWHQASDQASSSELAIPSQEPDLRTWLLGFGAGVAFGAVLSWLGLAAFRFSSPQAQVMSTAPAIDPRTASAGGTATVVPPPNTPSVPAPASGLQACANLALPQAEIQRMAAANNFGKRQSSDAMGASIPSTPALIVLHETVLDLPSTIALFQRDEPNGAVQASYHVLIGRDGERVRIVPDQDRAFGAGDSAFGDLRFKTSATNPPSINNIALHVSLESPPDGRGDASAHAGYTADQYSALAEQVLRWQAVYGIPKERITTHAAVDRSHSRYDPRSFRWDLFDQAYDEARRRCV